MEPMKEENSCYYLTLYCKYVYYLTFDKNHQEILVWIVPCYVCRMAYLIGGYASPMAKKGSIAVTEDKWPVCAE